MMGIAEMFGELDGYDRYWQSVAVRAEHVLATRRDRYRSDPAWRSHRLAYLRTWRASRKPYGPVRIEHDSASGYARGCRCDGCERAGWRARRAGVARKRSQKPEAA